MVSIYLLILMVVGSYARQNGAPEQACANMVPQHGSSAQTTASPYILQTVMMQNGSSITVQVTIWSQRVYRGFLLLGRNEGSSNTEYTGMFATIPSGSQRRCGQNQGVTHTQNNDKSNMTFEWEAPSSYCGNIIFRATVVENFSTFWTGITSDTLTINCTDGRTMIPTTTTAMGSTRSMTEMPGSAQINGLSLRQLLSCLTVSLLVVLRSRW